MLSAFIAQVYLADDKAANIPPELIVSEPLPDSAELKTALSFVADKKFGSVSGSVAIVPNGLSWPAPMRKRPCRASLPVNSQC